jgi:hypothetical protein
LNYPQKAHDENSTGKIITAERRKGASLAPQKHHKCAAKCAKHAPFESQQNQQYQ